MSTTSPSSIRYFLAETTIDKSDINDLVEWLQTNPWLTQGPLVKQYEQSWSNWIGLPHSVFVNSGSSANLLMYYSLLASGRLKNLKVVVPAVSWVTSVAPAIQLGFEPLMCEADPTTYGLDPDALEKICIEHNPAVVLLVHVLGVPCQMDKIMKLKERFGFFLLEDSCAAMGSRYNNQLVGTFGEMASFSLYFGHHSSTMEGGMVVTSDPELNDMLLMLRSHGWTKDLSPEKQQAMAEEHNVQTFNRTFTFYHPGFNVRATDLQARIGLSQMKKIEHVFTRRIENHRVYQSRIEQCPQLTCQSNPQAAICSISFMAVAQSSEHRARIAEVLKANGIETRPVGGGNMSRQPFWNSRYGSTVYAQADLLHDCAFQLPNHPGLSPKDINDICDVVTAVQ